MCTQCLCTSTYFDAAGADENVLKEASENWKLEVIKNLESRTSMQRDPICSWKGCCLNFSLYFQYIFNIYIYIRILYISIYFLWFLYILYLIYTHWPTPRSPSGQQTKRPLPGHISRIFDRCGAGLGPVESGIGSGQGGTILWHDVTSDIFQDIEGFKGPFQVKVNMFQFKSHCNIQLSSSRMLYLLMMLFLDHLDPFLNLCPG